MCYAYVHVCSSPESRIYVLYDDLMMVDVASDTNVLTRRVCVCLYACVCVWLLRIMIMYHSSCMQYLEKGGRFGRKQSAAKGCSDPIRCYG